MKKLYFLEDDFWIDLENKVLIRKPYKFVKSFYQRGVTNLYYLLRLFFISWENVIIAPWGIFWIPSLLNILKLKKFTIISLTCDTFLWRKTIAGRYDGIIGRIKYFLASLTYKEPKFYIYCSKVIRDELLYFWIAEEKLIYKYQEWFRDISRAEKFIHFTPNTSSNHILFIGHYYNMLQKRLDILIDAYIPIFDSWKFSDMKLTVVWWGWEKFFWAEKMTYFSTKNIVFKWYNYDIDSFIQEAAFYVHPGEYEWFWVVVLEAMSAGLIPLISNLTWAVEVVSFLWDDFISSLSKEAFESKLINLLSLSNEVRQEYSVQSRNYALMFTRENSLEGLETSLKKIINEL